ncbi:hypothetical protein LCGC14_2107210 [marine sediment metagenome]|uniref:Uncharacterized protein n=1 Tax=marine sediment metagenome TaxID=412755 RepID=A0A0F9GLB6_9ZZZZ
MTVNYRDNSTPSDIVSGVFGVEILTFVDNAAQGADQECREVIIWQNAGKTVKIGETAAVAASGPALNDSEAYLRIPISNTNLLFFGGTTGKKVNLLWRS